MPRSTRGGTLGLEHGAMAYAVLNGARALRFVTEGTLCSKLEGGQWAISAGEPAAVIELALNQQRTGAIATLSEDQAAWARGVAARI